MNKLILFCVISFIIVSISILMFVISMVKRGHQQDVQRWHALANMTGKSFTVDGETITSGCPVIKE